jgi:ATP-dependent Lon protease
MTIHPIASIDEEPEESIYSWSIRELQTSYEPQRTRHLVGYLPYYGEGRVTSAIQVFDKESKRIVTKSGRIYSLMGEPRYHPDGEYVWKRWKSLNNGQDECDVTDQYV